MALNYWHDYTLGEAIAAELEDHGETLADIQHLVAADYQSKDDALAAVIQGGHSYQLPWFTAWTPKRVLFNGTYDSNTWVASVPRHPCDEVVEPIGDGSY